MVNTPPALHTLKRKQTSLELALCYFPVITNAWIAEGKKTPSRLNFWLCPSFTRWKQGSALFQISRGPGNCKKVASRSENRVHIGRLQNISLNVEAKNEPTIARWGAGSYQSTWHRSQLPLKRTIGNKYWFILNKPSFQKLSGGFKPGHWDKNPLYLAVSWVKYILHPECLGSQCCVWWSFLKIFKGIN